MVKAVIFDCFGVLATEAWLSFKAKYFGNDQELLDRANHIIWQANSGLINYDDFMRAIAGLAGVTPTEAIKAIERNVPDEELFAYLRELKRGYKLGLLSNVAPGQLHNIFTKDQIGLFDAVVLSFENGFIKPQAEAYENAAKQIGADVSQCVFVDDQERNTNGAIKAGMKAILYSDAAHLRRELKPLLNS
jgi:putative hydrolase of the HAD superfamily